MYYWKLGEKTSKSIKRQQEMNSLKKNNSIFIERTRKFTSAMLDHLHLRGRESHFFGHGIILEMESLLIS